MEIRNIVIIGFSFLIITLCIYTKFVIDTWNYFTFVSVCVASMELVNFTGIMEITISVLIGVYIGFTISSIINTKTKK